jgi:hypothetical protein
MYITSVLADIMIRLTVAFQNARETQDTDFAQNYGWMIICLSTRTIGADVVNGLVMAACQYNF